MRGGIQNSKSSPNIARPAHLVFPEDCIGQLRPRTGSLDDEKKSDDPTIGFFTPRATVKEKTPVFNIPSIVVEHNADSPREEILNADEYETRNIKSSSNYDSVSDILDAVKQRLRKISNVTPSMRPPASNSRENASEGSLGDGKIQFALSQTPPVSYERGSAGLAANHSHQQPTLSPVIQCFSKE
ncbi:unnamed protein product [Caenorhabditis bovis]|uniref:Uncharacterized protein n=1 Tax=Caenorhabditis bovis TaxID=2654633 RepID=A0A8S1EP53_9PELO|nr:unnamed protein product [Caenorhabditis bovis]